MKRRRFIHTALAGAAVLAGSGVSRAASDSLPQPAVEGSLQHALENRRSTRAYAEGPLDEAALAGLLWAGFGVNREDSGKRTAPSAHDSRETDIYVAMANGLFRYDATSHSLDTIHTRDIRHLTGSQPFVDTAAANLVYVADFDRMGRIEDSRKPVIAAFTVGCICQNVALYCAANGLGNVVRDWIDREALRKEMSLTATQHIMLAQTVGLPA
ncbi:SagB/ThcOx family dehydrogenase [Oceanidesulfovibrio indonesiensis]|uniref:SagB/ThcOx family dehydrogenase n=1 Tax=Oceanidesulfovibrio indonesiensis TaxID=54767 RepID=A0A7M3MF92_9BACT|nr:SagB/ThcOx family dehydrogenase [Oceanidesulfovibrio indonesiensis]TVM17677.1 SagB/ThcOx family dehydrogenase [Oceanidesulfovibrio indonesiensis]